MNELIVADWKRYRWSLKYTKCIPTAVDDKTISCPTKTDLSWLGY